MTTKKLTKDSPTNNIVWININNFEALCFSLTREFMSFDQPIPDFETSNIGVLESCINTPLQKFDGKDLYATLIDKVAMLFYLIIKNHPFINGNKRTALTAMLVVLFINGYWVKTSPIKIYRLAKSVAISNRKHKEREINKITKFIENNLVKRS